ncbi:unnamed protein product, partial [Didymodactylos carnosus]
IPKIFHDRDFIYTLRELRFELTTSTMTENASVTGIKPLSLLRALEHNFNGISNEQFQKLTEIFFNCVRQQCKDFLLPSKKEQRSTLNILSDSLQLDSIRRRLYGRYKLIIDESEDESAIRLLFQTGIIDSDPNKTTIFRMSDFPDDINNEIRNVEILSTIKLCMETGKTIIMINTGRIHGSLYDVFNQNFSIMATGDTRKIFSKVAIGPKTLDVPVNEEFQCLVQIKHSEMKEIPAPFLSRFQKYSLNINDFYRIQFENLSKTDQIIMKNIEDKARTFIEHYGKQYFYGLNDNTLYSCLLSLIKINENNMEQEKNKTYLNVHHHYTQLEQKSKLIIEENPTDIQQCLLRSILSKLIQLVSPESLILKLPTFEDSIARWLCTNYFQNQEHFNIENFIRQLTTIPTDMINEGDQQQLSQKINITTKVTIFTRTSSYILGLNKNSKYQLFKETTDNNDEIDVLNLVSDFDYYKLTREPI